MTTADMYHQVQRHDLPADEGILNAETGRHKVSAGNRFNNTFNLTNFSFAMSFEQFSQGTPQAPSDSPLNQNGILLIDLLECDDGRQGFLWEHLRGNL